MLFSRGYKSVRGSHQDFTGDHCSNTINDLISIISGGFCENVKTLLLSEKPANIISQRL